MEQQRAGEAEPSSQSASMATGHEREFVWREGVEREEEEEKGEEECRLLEGLQGRWGLWYAVVAAAERWSTRRGNAVFFILFCSGWKTIALGVWTVVNNTGRSLQRKRGAPVTSNPLVSSTNGPCFRPPATHCCTQALCPVYILSLFDAPVEVTRGRCSHLHSHQYRGPRWTGGKEGKAAFYFVSGGGKKKHGIKTMQLQKWSRPCLINRNCWWCVHYHWRY